MQEENLALKAAVRAEIGCKMRPSSILCVSSDLQLERIQIRQHLPPTIGRLRLDPDPHLQVLVAYSGTRGVAAMKVSINCWTIGHTYW